MIEPAGLDPLVQGYAPGAPMGWRAGHPVAIERFLGMAAALARRSGLAATAYRVVHGEGH